MAVMSIMLRPQELPSITLNDGHIFSFAGVTAGKELPQSLKPTWVNTNIGDPIVKYFPKMDPTLREFKVIKRNFPSILFRTLKKDDITFWIQTRSTAGRRTVSSSGFSPEGLNGVDVEIVDTETSERFQCSGSGGFGVTDSLSYSFFHFRGIRNQTKHVTIVLRHKNDQGVLEESAIWEVEIP